MGYRDDFYKAGNIIGYSGNLHDCPTVYFQKGGLWGHITQRHGLPQNVGRHALRDNAFYEAHTYEITNEDTGNGIRLVEKLDGKIFHESRSTLTEVNHLQFQTLHILAQALIKNPNEKNISFFSGEDFDKIEAAEAGLRRALADLPGPA